MTLIGPYNSEQKFDYSIPGMKIYKEKGCFSLHSNNYVIPHWHDEVEYIYVEKGSILFSVNDQEYSLSAGEALIINSKHLHQCRIHQEDCYANIFYFEPQTLCSIVTIMNRYVPPLISSSNFNAIKLEQKNPDHKTIMSQFQRIFESVDSQEIYFEMSIISAFMIIIKKLLKLTSISQEAPSSDDKASESLRNMVDYIHKHFNERISIEDILRAGHVSRTQCFTVFRKYLQYTPIDYLMNHRVYQASLLLAKRKMSITEIAFACGFQSSSYFSKCFKACRGMTPHQFMQTISEDDLSFVLSGQHFD